MCDSREPEAGAGSVERREAPPTDIVAFAGGLLDERELDRAVLRAAHEAAVKLAARFELDPA